MNAKRDFSLSIIVCTLNSALFIQNHLRSVIKQSNQSYDLIFVDGGSTDNTIDLINETLATTSIKYSILYEYGGLVASMNRGILHSKSNYITFLNSDDMYFDFFVLDKVKDFIEQQDIDILYGRCLVLESNIVTQIYPKKSFSRAVLKYRNYIPHPSAFIKRSAFFEYGMYNEKYFFNFDYDFWIRLSKVSSTKIFYFPELVSFFRVHKKSLSFLNRKSIIISNYKLRRLHFPNYLYLFIFIPILVLDLLWLRYKNLQS